MGTPDHAVYVTESGLTAMKSELATLIDDRRAELERKLDVVTTQGGLSDNPQYDILKKEQAVLEARILMLEDGIRDAILIEAQTAADTVCLGSTVQIAEEGWDEIEEYRIVGIHEAAPANGLISNRSPIGSALLGARLGETVVALTPGGEMRLQVVNIS